MFKSRNRTCDNQINRKIKNRQQNGVIDEKPGNINSLQLYKLCENHEGSEFVKEQR